jgi:imidazolonepropionase
MKMTPAESVTAATINAAYSLNRGDQIGSLEPGKRANFALHDCADYRDIIYYFGVSLTHSVYVSGKRAF